MSASFVLRIDDVTPTMAWGAMDRLQRRTDRLGVPAVIGVVPLPQDPSLVVDEARPDFWEWVRGRRQVGWTVAQHGYRHVYDSPHPGMLIRRPRSEFAGLDLATQRDRLALGQDILRAEGAWDPVFMAPGHTFDRITVSALRNLGFTTVTDGYGLYPYQIGGLVFVPQLFFRPLDPGFGVLTMCLHLNGISERDFARLECFLESHAADFVSIRDAATVRAPAWVPKAALRGGTRMAQNGAHSLRQALRRR